MVAYRSKAKTSRGTTLVELLAVLAIIAMMAAVAVPIMMKAGFFASDRRTGSARELYAFLRAAKVYAAQNKVSAAVVYVGPPDIRAPEETPPLGFGYLWPVYDEQLRVSRHCAAAAFMARRLTRQEYEYLKGQLEGQAPPGFTLPVDYKRYYVALQSPNGNVTPMTKGTFAYFAAEDPETGEFADTDFGLKAVVVFDADIDLPDGDRDRFRFAIEPDGGLPGADHAWAHVFRPSGEMNAQGTQERFVISVGLKPEEDPNDRFFVELDGTLTENLVSIELYRSTGRIKISG